jgi:hypothetical protein
MECRPYIFPAPRFIWTIPLALVTAALAGSGDNDDDGSRPLTLTAQACADVTKTFSMAGVRVSQFPLLLVVNSSAARKSLADVIAAAKSKPGKLSFASAGVGTTPHLPGETLSQEADISIAHLLQRRRTGLNDLLSDSRSLSTSGARHHRFADTGGQAAPPPA